MITRELAVTLRHGQVLWHSTMTNADGTPLRGRVTGKCKTWKRSPEKWRLPMKHGLKTSFYITPTYASLWSLPDRWPVERLWQS